MRVRASILYGESYGWTDAWEDDDMVFRSMTDVVREVRSPGSVTGHPRSFFPCAGDWCVDPSMLASWPSGRPVAVIHAVTDDDEGFADPFKAVVVGRRGGLRLVSL